MAFKDQIDFEVIQKGEIKEGCTSQPISDIDGRSQEPIVGTPGGMFGELLNALAALEEHNEIELSAD
jgi:hypothetical protein